MNKLIKISNYFKFKRSNSTYIEVTWPEPMKRSNKPDKKKIYETLDYPDQLEYKKTSFLKSFQNVLITLAYDELQDKSFKDTQQKLGQQMLDNIDGLVPVEKRSLNELMSVDRLDIGYSQDKSRLVVGRNVWLSKAKQAGDNDKDDESDEIADGFSADNSLYCSNEFSEIYPDEFKKVARHVEAYINQNRLPVKQNLSYYAKNWNWHSVEIRRNDIGQIMLIVPLNPFNLTTVLYVFFESRQSKISVS